ncbi:MAG: c-type cytochrome [Campylobacterota bacterium]|nr:c-type cytochrome [Campylobacterota bacterium]
MNKLMLWGIIVTVVMLAATWMAVGGSKGGMGEDIVNQLAVAGAVALVIITVFVVIKYVRQMQNDTASGVLADENWDGIGEYKNELPFGWAIIFLGSIIWAFWYFIAGYPVNAYSQIGEYNEDVAAANAKFAQAHENMSPEDQVDMGQSVFIVQCAPCHGLSADGIDGKAADLRERISKEAVVYAIKNGGNNMKTDFPGGMPPMMLSDDAQINAVADYIAAGMPAGHKGAEAYMMGGCTGCHGDNGEGMPMVGPKLNGYDVATVASVLKDGKKGFIGAMPAFTNLTEPQINALGAYVSSLK